MSDISQVEVRNLFRHLQNNESEKFFARVRDDVQWTVKGTHPLAGHYRSKQNFLAATFSRLNLILQEGVVLKVEHIFTANNTAVVEMKSLSTAKNGKPFNNTYCWVVEFDSEKNIAVVRAYLDSALVQQIVDENE
ncbi:MAG: hypothetical protein V7723_06640 [Sneathiella sp.]|uniref:nuclear transport factor 2 family protein n=1 Tax=Sneathiella sp. TaxID=1964365 RepID=UPI003002D60C